LFIPAYISAQTNNKPSLDKGTIENQFNYVITSSSKYEDYKVVKEGWLWVLRSHVIDTLKLMQKEKNDILTASNKKSIIIDSLKSEVAKITEKHDAMYKEKNSLRFLGILMSKGGYNSLMWTIVVVLMVFLFIFVVLFKRSNVVTVQTKQDLEELKEEFESHRKRALEREEKLARQYMNELKKYKK
jgi:hypothetical protein